MNADVFDTFDFLINDEDEVMLLLYEREGEPENPRIELNAEENAALLVRNETDDTLMVCELSRTENEKETEIVHAYEAEISD